MRRGCPWTTPTRLHGTEAHHGKVTCLAIYYSDRARSKTIKYFFFHLATFCRSVSDTFQQWAVIRASFPVDVLVICITLSPTQRLFSNLLGDRSDICKWDLVTLLHGAGGRGKGREE